MRLPALAFSLTCLALVLSAGCSVTKGGGGSGQATGGSKTMQASLLLDTGGVDDRSFNSAAWLGMQQASKETGVASKYVECKTDADYKPNMSILASQHPGIVVAVGFAMEDALKSVAPQYPGVKFAIVDGTAPASPNCVALQFREQEGTFLAGYLAASMSKTKTIGFVGGMDVPLIRKFEAGYRAGAKTANPNVHVISSYTGDWADVNKGKSQALQQIGNGADIVFQAAGKSGLGVIEAVKEKGPGYYAIGVDQDQDGLVPGRILTSVVKHVDTAVADEVKDVAAGQFQPGTKVFGLKEGGMSLSPMKYTKDKIPAAGLARVQTLQQMIVDGKLRPPTTMDELASFQAPKI